MAIYQVQRVLNSNVGRTLDSHHVNISAFVSAYLLKAERKKKRMKQEKKKNTREEIIKKK